MIQIIQDVGRNGRGVAVDRQTDALAVVYSDEQSTLSSDTAVDSATDRDLTQHADVSEANFYLITGE